VGGVDAALGHGVGEHPAGADQVGAELGEQQPVGPHGAHRLGDPGEERRHALVLVVDGLAVAQAEEVLVQHPVAGLVEPPGAGLFERVGAVVQPDRAPARLAGSSSITRSTPRSSLQPRRAIDTVRPRAARRPSSGVQARPGQIGSGSAGVACRRGALIGRPTQPSPAR
jgi:hypothetical protein